MLLQALGIYSQAQATSSQSRGGTEVGWGQSRQESYVIQEGSVQGHARTFSAGPEPTAPVLSSLALCGSASLRRVWAVPGPSAPLDLFLEPDNFSEDLQLVVRLQSHQGLPCPLRCWGSLEWPPSPGLHSPCPFLAFEGLLLAHNPAGSWS